MARERKLTPIIDQWLTRLVLARLDIPSDKEIAEVVGVSKFTISRRMCEIRGKVQTIALDTDKPNANT